MWRPLAESEPFFQTSWRSLVQVNEFAHRLGAQYALFILPRYQQYNRKESPRDIKRSQIPESDEYLFQVFDWFDRQAATVQFPVHSLLPDFRDSGAFPTVLEDDFHFSEIGHQVAAAAITRYLLADGLIPDQ